MLRTLNKTAHFQFQHPAALDLSNNILFVTYFVNNRWNAYLLRPFPTIQNERRKRNDRKVKLLIRYTMSNDNLAIYKGYQYRLHVQGNEVIEVDVYI
jgi:hypothetical protein